MTAGEMRRYRERWLKVDAAAAEEERRASFELRWRQVNSLYALAVILGLPLHDQAEEAEQFVVYQRWATLRERSRHERR